MGGQNVSHSLIYLSMIVSFLVPDQNNIKFILSYEINHHFFYTSIEEEKKLYRTGNNLQLKNNPDWGRTEIEFFTGKDLRIIVWTVNQSLVVDQEENVYLFGSPLTSSDTSEKKEEIQHLSFFSGHKIWDACFGLSFLLVLTDQGLFSLGENNSGQLGLGNTHDQSTPQKILFFQEKDVFGIACGADFAFALTTEGLFSWGDNTFSQTLADTALGTDDVSDDAINIPQKVTLFEDPEIFSISCGLSHVLILTSQGLYGAGDNAAGQLGVGNYLSIQIPQKIHFFDQHEVLQMCCGKSFSLVLTNQGLFSFGNNFKGQLGLGHRSRSAFPQKIFFFENKEIITIQSFSVGLFSLVLTTDGLYGFGENSNGQLGIAHPRDEPSPQKSLLFDNPMDIMLPLNRLSQCILDVLTFFILTLFFELCFLF